MKYVIAMIVMCGLAMGQNPQVYTSQAKSAAASTNGASGGSPGNAKASDTDNTNLSSDDGSVNISEKPIAKKKHAAEIPASLLGGSADPNVASKMAESERANDDETEGLASQAKAAKPKMATVNAAPKGKLHFNELEPGSDPVSNTVRSLEMYANDHNDADTEIRVRDWVKNNANVMATSPAEMRRKQQYQPTKDRLIQLGFPKEWFEAATPAAAQ